MTQGKQYPKPPIDEAVVEFLFDPKQEWDGTVPGKLQAELAAAYPGKAQTQTMFSLALAPQGSAAPFVSQASARTLLPNSDRTRLVGVAPNLLTVHALNPYRGWDEFSARAREALSAYWKVNEPAGVRRIRIRYINRIVIPGESVNLNEYFTAAPGLPGEMASAHLRNFITRIETPYDDDGSVLVMTFAPAPARPPQKECCAFVLDFDLLRSFEAAQDSAATLAALEVLRTRERAAFEAMITDATRNLFQ